MPYKPRPASRTILDRALYYVQSVAYSVTARWVFYRLLQEGLYISKAGYKNLLGTLSKARKEFYGGWRPWTLADDTRAPILLEREGFYTIHRRGSGFTDEKEWLATLKQEINCPLDRFPTQPIYAEIWFEAAAMQGQFRYYANENLPLLAFHGDVSIPEKWRAAERLAQRYNELKKPIHVYYFGDYDEKGEQIPLSAWRDIGTWAVALLVNQGVEAHEASRLLNYHRVGINADQIDELNIPENPENPGEYQWEALDDEQAEELILSANSLLNMEAFDQVERHEQDIAERLRRSVK